MTSQEPAAQPRECIRKSITSLLDSIRPSFPVRGKTCPTIPFTSESRCLESLNDKPLDLSILVEQALQDTAVAQETVLYLAYGSNLSAETFRGARGIRPLSQVNVLVPELVATFDLPGVPYSEPCFGNTRYRDIAATTSGYHKDRWHKGLVGVVYEVTKADYAHIIATEGGGSGYKDVIVDCYTLAIDPTEEVPLNPEGKTFKAHTLFAPGKISRPDSSYAQPSARYLKLITDGAEECSLPYEYQTYLKGIRTYTITNNKQRLGQFIMLALWAPLFALIFGAGKMFLDKSGRYPPWFVQFANGVFAAVWGSYDDFFKPLFGDGERTADERDGDVDDKEPLLSGSNSRKYRSVDERSDGGSLEKGMPV